MSKHTPGEADTPQKIINDVVVQCEIDITEGRETVSFAILEAPARIQALIDAKAALLDEAVAACQSVEDHLLKTFPPYPKGQSPYDKVCAVLAKVAEQKGE